MLEKTIKILRKSRGWSQKELANRIGADRGSVSNWENGNRRVSPDFLQPLADEFGVDVDELIGLRRASEQTPESAQAGDLVGSKSDVYHWRNDVVSSDLSATAKLVLSALPAFSHREGWIVSATPEQIAERSGVDVSSIRSVWDEIESSGFIRDNNPAMEFVLSLVFPENGE